MKISKSKLKQLIKEELELVLHESRGRPDPLIEKLISLSTDWMPAWDESSIKRSPAAAFVEAMQAVKRHWFTTIREQWMGCSNDANTGECRTLLKLATLWKKFPSKLLGLADKYDNRGKHPKHGHAIKMAKTLNTWVPPDKKQSFLQLAIWKNNLMASGDEED